MERETERDRERESKRAVRHHRDRITAHTRPLGRDERATNRAPRTETTEQQHERARPTQDRAREGENRETKHVSPNKGGRYSKRERREKLAHKRGSTTESKGEHASKLENSRREREGEAGRKSRRAIRHHCDRIALHASSQCRNKRAT